MKHSRMGVFLTTALTSIVLAGCGGDGEDANKTSTAKNNAPAFAQTFADSVDKTWDVTSAHVEAEGVLKVELADGGDAAAKELLKNPIKIRAKVDTGTKMDSKRNVELAYDLGEGYKSVQFLQVDDKSFVKYADKWFATTSSIFDEATGASGLGSDLGGESGLDTPMPTSDVPDKAQILALIRQQSDSVVSATGTDGPDIEGPTWLYNVKLNPEGIRDLLVASGEQAPTTEEFNEFKALLDVIDIQVVIGKEDKFMHQVKMTLDLDAKSIASLSAANSASYGDVAKTLKAAKLDVTVTATKFNQKFEVAAPTGDIGTEDELGTLVQSDIMALYMKYSGGAFPSTATPNTASPEQTVPQEVTPESSGIEVPQVTTAP